LNSCTTSRAWNEIKNGGRDKMAGGKIKMQNEREKDILKRITAGVT